MQYSTQTCSKFAYTKRRDTSEDQNIYLRVFYFIFEIEHFLFK